MLQMTELTASSQHNTNFDMILQLFISLKTKFL